MDQIKSRIDFVKAGRPVFKDLEALNPAGGRLQQRVVILTYFVGGNGREFLLRRELINENNVAIINLQRIACGCEGSYIVPVFHDNMKRIP